MTDYDEWQRIATAYHECSHAVAAWACGRAVQRVSLKPEHGHFGISEYSTSTYDGPIPESGYLPRGEFREAVEAEIVVMLAGAFGEGLARLGPDRSDPHPDEEWAELAAKVLAEQSPRHREFAERSRRGEVTWADERPLSADEHAALAASNMVGGKESTLHYAWMREVAHRLVYEQRFRIQRLSEALLLDPSREIVDPRLTAIIEGAAPEPS